MKRISTRSIGRSAPAPRAVLGATAFFQAAVRRVASVAALAAALAAAGAAAQPPAHAPTDEPGWTGTEHAQDVIAARRGLMLELQTLMMPIDSHAAGEPADPDELRAAARTISAMLATVPHLFPPTTNLQKPEAEEPVTLALPAVWESFPGFYALASVAASAAAKMATTEATADLPAAARALRGACDSCHASYMRQYAAPEVTPEDLEFDFDSVFDSK